MEGLVTEINVSKNLLTVFPSFVSQFSRIAFLNLANNTFSDLPKQLGLLATLRELNIANNRYVVFTNYFIVVVGTIIWN